MLKKIISGGQTGIDRVGLNVGISLGLKIGGWAPKNNLSEDGKVPKLYGLKEYTIPGYAARTEQNILDADATLIFKPEYMCRSQGTFLTRRLCRRHKVGYIVVDACHDFEENAQFIEQWLYDHKIRTLNVAGPRKSVLEDWSKKWYPSPKWPYAHACYQTLFEAVTRLLSRK